VLSGLDTLMTRIQKGQGTLARLTTDSILDTGTTATLAALRALVAGIPVNPRKYFRFRVC
jgi:hypothetical protein